MQPAEVSPVPAEPHIFGTINYLICVSSYEPNSSNPSASKTEKQTNQTLFMLFILQCCVHYSINAKTR